MFNENQTRMAIRDNNGIKITDDIKKAFPAVFNTRRSTNVSEDYKLYRSDKVIEIMEDQGLVLTSIGQERVSWSAKRQPHTQIHMMRFRDPKLNQKMFGVGDSFPEIVVMNSHDGRRLFRAEAGVFRLVCANGMVVADSRLGSISRRHYGEQNDFDKVKDVLADLPKVVKNISSAINGWSGIDLTRAEQIALARIMMKSRGVPEWLKPEQVIEAQREADMPSGDGSRSLWLTFNVAQERLTNDKIVNEREGKRPLSMRPINAVISNTSVNRKLWADATAYAEKAAKRKGIELEIA